MNVNEFIILALALLSIHSFIAMCMQLLKFVIEDYFKIDNETRGIKAKMCWLFGVVFAAGALIAPLVLNVQLPINISTLALAGIIVLDLMVSCANVRIWYNQLKEAKGVDIECL